MYMYVCHVTCMKKLHRIHRKTCPMGFSIGLRLPVLDINRNMVPAVSPMSGSPTFDTEKKKKTKKSSKANLIITPPRPTGTRSNYST